MEMGTLTVSCGSSSFNRYLDRKQNGRNFMLRNLGGDARHLGASINGIIDRYNIDIVRVYGHDNCTFTGILLSVLRNPKGISGTLQERLTKDFKDIKVENPTREDIERHHAWLQEKFIIGLRRREEPLIATFDNVKTSRTRMPRSAANYTLVIGTASTTRYSEVADVAGLNLKNTFFIQSNYIEEICQT